ncbi:MAG: hypothetical protein Q8M29_03805 [Bacteroidota bacterium]|nr:hypothetical protein [Bacteroidota bacterium]
MIKKVVMDGRSAMAAEIGEYDVFPVDYLRKNVSTFESFAVNNSDYRMAVSQKLIEYWREHYNYTGNDHVVIPCTLDRKHFANDNFVLSETSLQLKVEMGISDTDIVLGYSGSTAPWQSFELLEKILVPLMDRDERIKVMFLSKTNKDNEQLRSKYKDRVIIKWVEHGEVLDHLACCDYGILLREQSDTNKVASPTKFAEYLYAGLPVLISENLGDFSEYVKTNDCGSVVYMNEPDWSFLKKNGIEVKKKCFEYAKRDFLKTSNDNTEAYKKLVEVLK